MLGTSRMLESQIDKAALRMRARSRRDALPQHMRKALSTRIVHHIQLWLEARPHVYRLGLYMPMGSEVNIAPLFAWCVATSRRAYAPRVLASGAGLCFVPVDEHTLCRRAKGGFFEPQGLGVATAELHVVFVPALLFDARGFRLGYGGGHYDRALFKTVAYTIGVGYAAQRVRHLPAAQHDVGLHAFVDETALKPFFSPLQQTIASAADFT